MLTTGGSAMLTMNGSAPLTTSRVHNCPPINMWGIRITIKVVVFLMSGGEKGQRIHPERVKRICRRQIHAITHKNGVRKGVLKPREIPLSPPLEKGEF